MHLNDEEQQKKAASQTQSSEPEQEQQELDLDTFTQKAAKSLGVPDIYRRMVNQESGGSTSATSPKGARGQFQLMPETARNIKRPDGQAINPDDPFDNAYGGLKYLRDNYDKFRSRAKSEKHAWSMAIAAYHAGPGRVEESLNAGGDGIPDWVDDGLINTREHTYRIVKDASESEFQLTSESAPTPEQEAQPEATVDVIKTNTRAYQSQKQVPPKPVQQPEAVEPLASFTPEHVVTPETFIPSDNSAFRMVLPVSATDSPDSLIQKAYAQLFRAKGLDEEDALREAQILSEARQVQGRTGGFVPFSNTPLAAGAFDEAIKRGEETIVIDNPDDIEYIKARSNEIRDEKFKTDFIEKYGEEPDRFNNAKNKLVTGFTSYAVQGLHGLAALSASIDGLDTPGDKTELYRQASLLAQDAENAFPSDPRLQDEYIAAKIPEALGSAIATVATGVVGGHYGLGVSAALAQAGSMYEEAKAAGATEQEATDSAWIGVPIGLTEMVPVAAMANRLRKLFPGVTEAGLRTALKEAGLTALKEGGEELVQNTGQGVLTNVVARYVYDSNKPIFGNVKDDAVVGTVTGFLLGGSTHLTSSAVSAGVEKVRGEQTDTPEAQPQAPVVADEPQAIQTSAQPQLPEPQIRVTHAEPGEARQQASPRGLAIANEFIQQKTNGKRQVNPDIGNVQVPDELSRKFADWYDDAKHTPEAPEVKKSYDALTNEVGEQYKQLTDKGINFEPWEGQGKPYRNSAEMRADMENGHLYYFRTDKGFGENKDVANHPMLQPSPFKDSKGEAMPWNDVFRAVHDAYAHWVYGFEFGPRGEWNATRAHAETLSPEALPALLAETQGQNSFVNMGRHLRRDDGSIPQKGDVDFTPPQERRFADQKAVVPPTELVREWLDYNAANAKAPLATPINPTVSATSVTTSTTGVAPTQLEKAPEKQTREIAKLGKKSVEILKEEKVDGKTRLTIQVQGEPSQRFVSPKELTGRRVVAIKDATQPVQITNPTYTSQERTETTTLEGPGKTPAGPNTIPVDGVNVPVDAFQKEAYRRLQQTYGDTIQAIRSMDISEEAKQTRIEEAKDKFQTLKRAIATDSAIESEKSNKDGWLSQKTTTIRKAFGTQINLSDVDANVKTPTRFKEFTPVRLPNGKTATVIGSAGAGKVRVRLDETNSRGQHTEATIRKSSLEIIKVPSRSNTNITASESVGIEPKKVEAAKPKQTQKSELQQRYERAKEKVKELKKEAKLESSSTGPVHQMLQEAEKAAKGLGMQLSAENRSIGRRKSKEDSDAIKVLSKSGEELPNGKRFVQQPDGSIVPVLSASKAKNGGFNVTTVDDKGSTYSFNTDKSGAKFVTDKDAIAKGLTLESHPGYQQSLASGSNEARASREPEGFKPFEDALGRAVSRGVKTEEEVRQTVESGNFAVISGIHGDFGKPGTDDSDNLMRALVNHGFKVNDASGMYMGQAEPLFFVKVDDESDLNTIKRLAKEFGQTQVMFGRQGKFTAPFTNGPDVGKETFGSKLEMDFESPEAGYTIVHLDNGKDVSFSVHDLFENTRTETPLPSSIRASIPFEKMSLPKAVVESASKFQDGSIHSEADGESVFVSPETINYIKDNVQRVLSPSLDYYGVALQSDKTSRLLAHLGNIKANLRMGKVPKNLTQSQAEALAKLHSDIRSTFETGKPEVTNLIVVRPDRTVTDIISTRSHEATHLEQLKQGGGELRLFSKPNTAKRFLELPGVKRWVKEVKTSHYASLDGQTTAAEIMAHFLSGEWRHLKISDETMLDAYVDFVMTYAVVEGKADKLKELTKHALVNLEEFHGQTENDNTTSTGRGTREHFGETLQNSSNSGARSSEETTGEGNSGETSSGDGFGAELAQASYKGFKEEYGEFIREVLDEDLSDAKLRSYYADEKAYLKSKLPGKTIYRAIVGNDVDLAEIGSYWTDDVSVARNWSPPDDGYSGKLIQHGSLAVVAAEVSSSLHGIDINGTIAARISSPSEKEVRVSDTSKLLNIRVLDDTLGQAVSKSLTNTPEFKNWFKSSKVVDEHGNPLVVYHTTTKDFTQFSKAGTRHDEGFFGHGFYFTPEPGMAELYIEGQTSKREKQAVRGLPVGTNMMPLYLSVQNPYHMGPTEALEMEDSFESNNREEFTERIKERGYDGIFVHRYDVTDPEPDEIVVFEPTQIKSAIGNSGKFNPNDSSILAQGQQTFTQQQTENQNLAKFDRDTWLDLVLDAAPDGVLTAKKQAEFDTLVTEAQNALSTGNDKETRKKAKALLKFYGEVNPSRLPDLLNHTARAAMLLGIQVAERNAISNAIYNTAESMARYGDWATDWALYVLGYNKQHESPNLAALAKADLYGVAKGITKGLKESGKELFKPRVSKLLSGEGVDNTVRAKFGLFSPLAKISNVGYSLTGAQDKPFREFARYRAIHDMAATVARNTPGNRAAKQAAFDAIMQSPPPEVLDKAEVVSQVAVFQQNNKLNDKYQNALSKLDRTMIGRGAKAALNWVQPFVKTNLNIGNAVFDFMGIRPVFKALVDKEAHQFYANRDAKRDAGLSFEKATREAWQELKPEQRQAVQRYLSRGLVGSALMMFGIGLYLAGKLTPWDDDETQAYRNNVELSGAGPGHVKIGNYWIDIRYTGPVGAMVLSGGTFAHVMFKQGVGEKVNGALNVFQKILLESNPMAQTAQELFKDTKNGRIRAVAQPQRFIPPLSAEIARLQDRKSIFDVSGVARDTTGDDEVSRTTNLIKARLPKTPLNPSFNRLSLPASADVLGREKSDANPLYPFVPKAVVDDEVVSELGKHKTPLVRSTANKEKGETPTQLRVRQKAEGRSMEDFLRRGIGQPGYQGNEPESLKALAREGKAITTNDKLQAPEKDSNARLIVRSVEAVARAKNILAEHPELTDEQKKEVLEKVQTLFTSSKASRTPNLGLPKTIPAEADITAQLYSNPELLRTIVQQFILEVTAFKP